jgi:mannose-1-phosphate guanylyltransferase
VTDNTPAQTDSTQTLLTPVVLSGGSGTRLWPLSRPERPKQFIALAGTESMMRQTLARTDGIEGATPPIIVANAAHADLVQAQLAGDAATVVLEPCARNTAPAIALAALLAPEPSAVLLVMPSDHVITDTAAFRDAVSRALPCR